MIIGVTGFFAAGKDSFADYLQQKGFKHFSLSDMIREELRSRGMEINIPNLTEVGNELRRAEGNGVLGKRAAQKSLEEENVIITSIRHPDEVNAIREVVDSFKMIFVNAPIKVRYERSISRDRAGDFQSFDEFEAAEKKQMESNDPAAQQLVACKNMADIELNNDSTLETFHKQIDQILMELN